MTDRERLDALIEAVETWAARPTKNGAKKLLSIAHNLKNYDPVINPEKVYLPAKRKGN